MSAGQIEQVGTPQEIYGEPQTIFVAASSARSTR
jgi:ABC-type Fe3+/spermidine/putrescine transport system ATPase subunit